MFRIHQDCWSESSIKGVLANLVNPRRFPCFSLQLHMFCWRKFYSLNSQCITHILIHKFKVRNIISSEFFSAATVQGNRGHMAWCLQHHCSQPQGSLTDQASQFLSFLLPLLQQDRTLKRIVLSLSISLLHRWKKNADRVWPLLQRWGPGLCSPSRNVYQWIDGTYQLRVVLKLQLVISIYSSTQEHLMLLNQFSSPLPDRRNMLVACCCSVFKATPPR